MAEKWERLQETKDLFPNLEFRTVGDDRVRDEHERLNGIIKPIDDDFWSRYYPPLDWRCRCDVVATAEDADDKLPEDLPNVKFKGNVGKDKEIFTSKGTFFKLLNTNENAVKNAEYSKTLAPIELVYKKGKAKVTANIFHDISDQVPNIESAIKIVDELKISVHIKPLVNVDGFKNNEYVINKLESDLKWNFKDENYNGIKNALQAAKKQNCKSIVFDFTKRFKKLDIVKVYQSVISKVNKNHGKSFEEFIFIYKNKAVLVTRKEIIEGKLLELLQKIKAD